MPDLPSPWGGSCLARALLGVHPEGSRRVARAMGPCAARVTPRSRPGDARTAGIDLNAFNGSVRRGHAPARWFAGEFGGTQ